MITISADITSSSNRKNPIWGKPCIHQTLKISFEESSIIFRSTHLLSEHYNTEIEQRQIYVIKYILNLVRGYLRPIKIYIACFTRFCVFSIYTRAVGKTIITGMGQGTEDDEINKKTTLVCVVNVAVLVESFFLQTDREQLKIRKDLTLTITDHRSEVTCY